jgi:serine phosphatase RsbU (regulator of sigma subunit)/TPR repeat protein
MSPFQRIIYLLFTTFLLQGYCAQSITDSLLNKYTNSKDVISKIENCNNLINQLIYIDVVEAKKYVDEAYAIVKTSGSKKLNVEVNLTFYELLTYQNEDDRAVEILLESIQLSKDIDYKNGLAHAYNKLGAIYLKKEILTKAMEYFKEANNVFVKINDLEGQKNTLNNIGVIYYYQEEMQQSINFFEQSLSIEKKLNNKEGMCASLANIGGIYCDMEPPNYSMAEEKLLESIQIAKEINSSSSLSTGYINLSYLYLTSGDLEKAQKYADDAVMLSNANGLIDSKIIALDNKREILIELNDFESAVNISLEMEDLIDANYSSENNKTMAELEAVYQNKAKQKENELLKKKGEIDQLELEYETQKSYYLLFGLIAFAGIAGFAINRYYISQKRKKVIEKQKEEVEHQKELIIQQKHIVDEKNQEISDSILYAQRIQNAILPPVASLKKKLKNGFLLFKPKDTVSGDFYWLQEFDNLLIFAVADCTGHGVPGAMVSVICNNALNRSVREYHLTDPGEILDKTRELVIETFKLSGENVKDGMDISLCCYNPHSQSLSWAGANNPLWILRKNYTNSISIEPKQKIGEFGDITLIELLPTKQPIGNYELKEKFSTQNIQLLKGDSLILFSDGYADQFGGERGKKLKYKPFKELLISIFDLEMENQKDELDMFFDKWKGDHEQIDDVCVIGVKI